MTTLEKLIQHFERFPGIGVRQARRFVHHLLTEDRQSVAELSTLIASVHDALLECPSCFRFFSPNGHRTVCGICADESRDRTKLMIVERDSDLEAVERSRTYDGSYFILGGTVPLLEGEDTKKLRGGALKHLVNEGVAHGLKEIILAFSINPDGENTARYVETLLRDPLKDNTITISHLGRGLSTGSELEYADPETIKNALKNRS